MKAIPKVREVLVGYKEHVIGGRRSCGAGQNS